MRFRLRTLLIVMLCFAAVTAGYSELLRRHDAWSRKVQMEDELPPDHPVAIEMQKKYEEFKAERRINR